MFTRRWSKANVSVDCNALSAEIAMADGRVLSSSTPYQPPATASGLGSGGYGGRGFAIPEKTQKSGAMKSDDSSGGATLDWFVTSGSLKLEATGDNAAARHASSRSVSLAGMRGECEHAQLAVRIADPTISALRNITLRISDLTDESGGTFAAERWSYKQQGFVACPHPPSKNKHTSPCGMLLEVSGGVFRV